MQRPLTLLALSLVCAEHLAYAQSIETGAQSTRLESFLLYPHLQKGFTALERGDRSSALAEFERAHALAPNNPTVATYLAQAYRRFGERSQAVAVLTEQLKRNQGNVELLKVLGDLQAQGQPIAASSHPISVAVPVSIPVAIPVAIVPAPAKPVVIAPTTSSPQTSLKRISHSASKVAMATPKATKNFAPRVAKIPTRVAPQLLAITQTAKPTTEILASSASLPQVMPLQEPSLPAGYQAADKAYKSSADGDYVTALALARQAVREAPDHRAYLYLLTYVAAQSGSYEEADQVASKALSVYPASENSDLLQLHQKIRRYLSHQNFEAANKALASDQALAAVQHARKGMEYAPNVLAQRVQWLNALLLTHQYSTVIDAATDALQNFNGSPVLYMLRAYARLALGDTTQAWTDFDLAVQDVSLTPTEVNNFRMIAAQAAMAATEPARAMQWLSPLDEKTDQSIALRRQMASASMRRSIFVNLDAASAPALAAPGVICAGTIQTAACDLWPGQTQADAAAPVAQSAYAAFSAREYGTATSKTQQALSVSPHNAAYRLLLINSLIADKQFERAEQVASAYLATYDKTSVSRNEILAVRSLVRYHLGKLELAQEDAEIALNSQQLSLHSEINLLLRLHQKYKAREIFVAAAQAGLLKNESLINVAYLGMQVGEDAYAISAFDKAEARGKLPDTARLDAAFLANRLGRYDAALVQFKNAVNASEAGQLALVAQPLFDIKREIAERTRNWGGAVSLSYRGMSPVNPGANQASAANDNVQSSAEIYWRPFGYQGGRTWELYSGLSATLSSKANYPTGSESVQGAIGARVKPLPDINLVGAIERRLALGDKTSSDWLVRTAYSSSTGTDMRVEEPSWTTTSVYAEAGRYIHQRQTYATVEGIAGRSYRMDGIHPRSVLMPHLVLGADYDSIIALGSKHAVGAGLGINFRQWFNEDRYNAPRSHLDISLQYRGRIGGDARAKGVLLRATLSY